MPGFSPQSLAYRVANANAALIVIGDQVLAFCQTTTHSFAFGTEPLYGVGTAKPQEIQQLRVLPSITVDNFALSEVGTTLLEGGQSFASIIANNQFTISVVDGITGLTRFSYIGCTANDFNETVAANRPITDAITFTAMDVLDQTGQSILNGQNATGVGSVQGTLGAFGLGVNIAA